MFRKKSVLITFICLFIVAAISFVYVLSSNPQSGFGIRHKKIKSITMYDSMMNQKEITNLFDKKHVISIIRNLNVERVPSDNITGLDYSAIIVLFCLVILSRILIYMTQKKYNLKDLCL